MKKLILILAVLNLSTLSAQDLVFTQKMASASHFNPAFAGLSNAPRISGVFRNQWPGLSTRYVSGLIAFDMPLNQINSGFGVNYFNDFAGNIFQKHEFNVQYAYHLPIGERSNLSAGFNTGLRYEYIDISKLTFPTEPENLIERKYIWELDFGVAYSTERFLIGGSINRIPQLFEETNYASYSINAAYIQPLGEHMNIGIESDLMEIGGFYLIRSSIQANYDFFVLGITHHHNSALGGILGFNFEKIQMSYNLAYQTSGFGIGGSAHEISVRFKFNSVDSNRFNWLFF